VADRETGTYYVNRVDGESLTRIEVTIGLRDARYTEVSSGLEEGDRVSTAQAVDDSLDFTQGPPAEARRVN
jgi:multidrug efflux pump subunit AcrA (membrane-fusion protein)